jgi:hypothetical protein
MELEGYRQINGILDKIPYEEPPLEIKTKILAYNKIDKSINNDFSKDRFGLIFARKNAFKFAFAASLIIILYLTVINLLNLPGWVGKYNNLSNLHEKGQTISLITPDSLTAIEIESSIKSVSSEIEGFTYGKPDISDSIEFFDIERIPTGANYSPYSDSRPYRVLRNQADKMNLLVDRITTF